MTKEQLILEVTSLERKIMKLVNDYNKDKDKATKDTNTKLN